jgi:hypothetical protein
LVEATEAAEASSARKKAAAKARKVAAKKRQDAAAASVGSAETLQQVEDSLQKSIPATVDELLRVEAVLSEMRSRAGTASHPIAAETAATGPVGVSWTDTNLPANPALQSDSGDERDELPALEDGAVAFFGRCPLLAYRKGRWNGSMQDLLVKVRATKSLVKTWDIVRMNLAKKFIMGHLRLCDPRLPTALESEGPIELTKRYIAMLKRFAKKHQSGASSPKKSAEQRSTLTGSKRRRLFKLVSQLRACGRFDWLADSYLALSERFKFVVLG